MRDMQRELIGALEAIPKSAKFNHESNCVLCANQPQNETSNTTPCISNFTKYKVSYFKRRKCAAKRAKSFIREESWEKRGGGRGTAGDREQVTGDRPEPPLR